MDVSRRLADGPWRLGAQFAHKSNAGLDEINPGVESLYLMLSRKF